MAIKASWAAGDVLAAADLTDTLAAKVSSKVIQIVAATCATQVGSASPTYADTGLTATITPTSASNKVLVFLSQNGLYKSANDTYLGLRLYRGGSLISQVESDAGWTAGTVAMQFGGVSLTTLDTPATASAVIYKTTFANTPAVGTVCDVRCLQRHRGCCPWMREPSRPRPHARGAA